MHFWLFIFFSGLLVEFFEVLGNLNARNNFLQDCSRDLNCRLNVRLVVSKINVDRLCVVLLEVINEMFGGR